MLYFSATYFLSYLSIKFWLSFPLALKSEPEVSL